jgi:hypothetical protein
MEQIIEDETVLKAQYRSNTIEDTIGLANYTGNKILWGLVALENKIRAQQNRGN